MSYGHSSHKYCDACYCNELDEAIEERDALRERLRQAEEALREILEEPHAFECRNIPPAPEDDCNCFRYIAHAFLAGQDRAPACVCPSPALHKELAEGRPIDPTKCAPPAPRGAFTGHPIGAERVADTRLLEDDAPPAPRCTCNSNCRDMGLPAVGYHAEGCPARR